MLMALLDKYGDTIDGNDRLAEAGNENKCKGRFAELFGELVSTMVDQ